MNNNTNKQKPAQAPPVKANPLRPIRRQAPKSNPAFPQRKPARPLPSAPGKTTPSAKSIDELRRQYGGWTQPPPPGYVDYPLIVTKRSLRDGIRPHVMRFTAVPDKNIKTAADGTRSVDPSDHNQFTRPVTLSRHDGRQPPIGRQLQEQDAPQPQHQQRYGQAPQEAIDEEETARIAAAKAERETQRAQDLAQIAPVAKDPNATSKKSKSNNTKKETISAVFKRPDESFQKQSELRFEESLPWHLEDADGKNAWVGSYVDSLSETVAAFVIEGSSFRMVPLEKYYKFTAKPPFTPYSLEQAENIMNKKAEVGRWAMIHEEKEAKAKQMAESRLHGRLRVKGESSSFKGSSREEKMDHDELDMSADEFQDDDEEPAPEREEDEDLKATQRKIRREQLGANLFGHGDEQEVERMAKEEEEDENQRKILGKAVRKMLLKREKEAVYATDSDDDPFASTDDDDEQEKEKEKEQSQLQSQPQPQLHQQQQQQQHGKQYLSKQEGPKIPVTQQAVAKTERATTPSGRKRSGSPFQPDPVPAKKMRTVPVPSLSQADIVAALPPEGITIGELVKKFNGRVGAGPGQVPNPEFISMVKDVTVLGSDKLIRRK